MKKLPLIIVLALAVVAGLRAELKLPAIIGDHMVLQQNQADPIWGWDKPGTKIKVTFAGKSYSTKAADDGKWQVKLDPMPANATPQKLTIKGTTKRVLEDVLIGEVWLCSGQSNMQFALYEPAAQGSPGDWRGDLLAAGADLPSVRMISVPQVGTQELQSDFKGSWEVSTPKTVLQFSAVGFMFGRHLYDILRVPVGLIDNSWGGSSAEAWVRRSALEQNPRFAELMDKTVKKEAFEQSPEGKAEFTRQFKAWEVQRDKAVAKGEFPPWGPRDWMTGQHRPGNLFAGVLHPLIGYGIKGVIWYQGESNAARAAEYQDLFPFLITQWRQEWGQGDFPFYWVQLANFKAVQPKPGESDWAELREAQTMTMSLPNTGQAVTIDLGEGNNIHPRNKYDVAARLVRWALVKDYGQKLAYRSPQMSTVKFNGAEAEVVFDCFGSKLRPFGEKEVSGFALCGADGVWHWGTGKIVGRDKVIVTSPDVAAPVAIRYAWADNPVCNLYSQDGLPATPFRSP